MTRRIIALFLSTALLAGCATALDTSFQKITLKTPGTDKGRCTIDNGVKRYQIYSDQTIEMQRNDENLKLSCTAPGNRRVETVIDRDLNAWTIANITNGVVPGVSYDHFSGALYDYPRVISVDFGSMPLTEYSLPEYEQPGAMAKSTQKIENYDAGVLQKNGDTVSTTNLRKMSPGEIKARSHPLGTDSQPPAVETYAP